MLGFQHILNNWRKLMNVETWLCAGRVRSKIEQEVNSDDITN